MEPAVSSTLTSDPDMCHRRVRAQVAHSASLLRAAEQQLRLHSTDAAIDLLVMAEGHLSAAQESVPGVPDEQRFDMQKRVSDVREQIEDFRVRMCQI
jgi:hypothetical protein